MGIPVVLVANNPFYYQTAHRDKNPRLPLWGRYDKSHFATGRILERFNDALKRAALRHPGVFYFDPRPVMDRLDRSRLFLDFVHLSPEGNEVMADALQRYLLENGLIPKDCRNRTAVQPPRRETPGRLSAGSASD